MWVNWVLRCCLRSLSYQRWAMCQCTHVIASLHSACSLYQQRCAMCQCKHTIASLHSASEQILSIEPWDIFFAAYSSKGLSCVNVVMRLLVWTVRLRICLSIEPWDIFFAGYPSKGVYLCPTTHVIASMNSTIGQMCGNWVLGYSLQLILAKNGLIRYLRYAVHLGKCLAI